MRGDCDDPGLAPPAGRSTSDTVALLMPQLQEDLPRLSLRDVLKRWDLLPHDA
jgi:hypothetical protein